MTEHRAAVRALIVAHAAGVLSTGHIEYPCSACSMPQWCRTPWANRTPSQGRGVRNKRVSSETVSPRSRRSRHVSVHTPGVKVLLCSRPKSRSTLHGCWKKATFRGSFRPFCRVSDTLPHSVSAHAVFRSQAPCGRACKDRHSQHGMLAHWPHVRPFALASCPRA